MTLYTVPTNQGTATTPDAVGDVAGERVADTPNTEKKKDKPKRHGSLALFCRKVRKRMTDTSSLSITFIFLYF